MSVQVTGNAPADKRQTQFIEKAPIPPAFLADITDKEVKGTKVITFNSAAPRAAMQHTIDGQQFDGATGASVLLGRVEEWKIMNTTSTAGPGPIDHPFHIHINPFQITEVFDPNEPLTDQNGRLEIDAQTGKPHPKYIFDSAARTRDEQCYRDARGNPADWKPCDNSGGSQPKLVWWDTFPIPSGKVATDAKGQTIKGSDGNPIVIPGYFKMRSRFVDFPGLWVLHCHILAHEDRGMMTVVEVRPLYPPVQHH